MVAPGEPNTTRIMTNSITETKSQHGPLAYHRIVVKAGTNVLTSSGTRLDRDAMANIVGQMAEVQAAGAQVILVTSGAIAAGREVMAKSRDAKGVGLGQMLAAVGQSRLMHAYQEMFAKHDIVVAQALLTHQDVEGRRGYLNVRNTLEALLANGIVPIVNENDVVDTEEISQERFGDNDTLSALVANIIDADLLLILSDVAGLYTADPNRDKSAQLIERVDEVDAATMALAEEHRSSTTRGGMGSKLRAASLATSTGVNVVIAGGQEPDVITHLARGASQGTIFPATANHLESRKRWLLSGTADSGGVLVIDEGAVKAVRRQSSSLLPAGVREVTGVFKRGDVVAIAEPGGKRIAVGVSNYDSDELGSIKGAKSSDIARLLGHSFGDEAIHRNNMAVL
jgi:glutamate 5-kinase